VSTLSPVLSPLTSHLVFAYSIDSSVTHLVCDPAKRTFKLLAAPLVGGMEPCPCVLPHVLCIDVFMSAVLCAYLCVFCVFICMSLYEYSLDHAVKVGGRKRNCRRFC